MAARYQHLSPAFLAEAVGRLDSVFGSFRYQDVTAPEVFEAVAGKLLTVFGVPYGSRTRVVAVKGKRPTSNSTKLSGMDSTYRTLGSYQFVS
jgi:hypothetical protein